jgi:arylsulfatase A-like enzyme
VVGVRTISAKLIKYPGHEEWTELFDLAKDPYELKNLARDPAQKDLLARMQVEYDRQAKAVSFTIPDYADKPGDAPPPPAAKRKSGKKKKSAI